MKSIKIYRLIIIALFFVSLTTKAQDNTMYFMQRIPQSTYTNPAFQPECNWYIGFPALSEFSFKFQNTGFSYNDLYKPGTGVNNKDSLFPDLYGIVNKLKTKNYITPEFSNEMFSFGFKIKDIAINFRFSNKTTLQVSYPKDLIAFGVNGNTSYLNKRADFGVGFNFTNYNEAALGASWKINDNLSVGATFKYLMGIANINFEKMNIGITTKIDTTPATNDNYISYDVDAKINTSLPLAVKMNQQGYVDFSNTKMDTTDLVKKILTNKNYGFGIDFGITYRVWKDLTVTASVIDLGYINWQATPSNFSGTHTYQFTGFDLANKNQNTVDLGQVVMDSLKKIQNVVYTQSAYKTFLTPKIYLGADWVYTKNFSFGALLKNEIYDNTFHPSFTLTAQAKFFKLWELTASYSMMDNRYDNLGFGISMRLTPIQIYIVSDNITAAMYPKDATMVNIRFGINLTFGCKKTEKKVYNEAKPLIDVPKTP